MKKSGRYRTAIAVAFMTLMAATAAATPANLPGDTNAMVLPWLNPEPFNGATLGGHTLTAKVEWAVYAPNQFNLSFPGLDPSSGQDYVYAYQIFNLGGGTGPAQLGTLSIGLAPGAVPLFWSLKGQDTSVGTAPATWAYSQNGAGVSSQIIATFTTKLPVGGMSDYLFFASPYPPVLQTSPFTSSMAGGNLTSANSVVPVPSPEPSTVVLGGVGLLCLLATRYFRRRRLA